MPAVQPIIDMSERGHGMTMAERAIEAGAQAPGGRVAGPEGGSFELSSLWQERPAVLVFLPDEESPFCTDNAAQLRDSEHLFEQAGARLAAVLPVGPVQAGAFASQWNLAFTVVADEHGTARAAFGIGPEQPAAFVIDTTGAIRWSHAGASIEDYPPTWELVQQACAVTGKEVERPKVTRLPRQAEQPPMLVERGAIVAGAYQCAKCGHASYEMQRVSATGGWLSRIFNFQLRGFTAITCTRCTYTELYRTEQGGMANVLDILFGR